MTPFLRRLAQEIAIRFGDDPGQLCVVLPNRRAGLYLKKYLAEEQKKSFWAPQTYSMDDFITQISGAKIIDQAGLLFEFYNVHRAMQGEKAQDFEAFAEWAPTLLRDFDAVDQYLVDPEKIFTFVSAARAINVWNLDGKPLTENESNYIDFFNSFLEYYQRLRDRLTGNKLTSEGMAYRVAALNIESLSKSFPWKKIFFAGLNALSGAEEKIIDFLVKNEMAEVFWDADAYYVEDQKQEAGLFIRDYLSKWSPGKVKWLENEFRNASKEIHIYGIPRSVGQAAKASQLACELQSGKDEPNMTALVLADESLLLPMLYSLPENIGPVNVTMGYPFRYTHLYNLTGLLFQMQENAEKFAATRKITSRSFYVNDVLKVITHPYITQFSRSDAEGNNSFRAIGESLRRNNRVFISREKMLRFFESGDPDAKALVEKLFSVWENPEQALEGLIEIVGLIRDIILGPDKEKSPEWQIDIEYLFHLSKIIRRVKTLIESYPLIQSLRALKKILFQLLDNSRLPFTGEPLHGLQVMGVLETRALDFENLIVLSANEGTLPSGRLPDSMIPFDIKTEFGLPTYQHKDAVFAYHFYRMIQRAKNIFLIYETEGDAMKGGEKSRFIMQLEYELHKINPGIRIHPEERTFSAPPISELKPIVRDKTPEVMERLWSKSQKGFSPSSLIVYIKCPLQFYFREVLGLSETEGIEETIEAKTMGTAIHYVLQKIYEPYLGKYVDPENLKKSAKNTEALLKEAFSAFYKEGDLGFGKNHLIFKVSHFLIKEFISQEAEWLMSCIDPASALRIISTESSFEKTIPVEVAGKELKIKIKGKVDRIDATDNLTRIIDYKTGLVTAQELNIKSWDKLTEDPGIAKAFQLLLYAWLYYGQNNTPGIELQTGNISLRSISSGFMAVRLPDDMPLGDESMKLFEDNLIGLLEKIMDPAIAFVQTEERKICAQCPFRIICTR